MGDHLVQLEWVADSVTDGEARTLGVLGDIVVRDLGLADHMAYLSWIADGIASDEVAALLLLLREKHDVFEQLTNQSWFADGLDDGEAAFLATARDIMDNSQNDFEAMMQTRYTRSETVALPNSGEVDTWAIQKAPFPPKEDITGTISRALLLMDEMMGVPLPISDIIVLVVVTGQEADYEVSLLNLGRAMAGSGACRLSCSNVTIRD